VDGYVLPDAPVALFQAGRYNRVPVIMSTTTDEETTIVSPSFRIPDDDAYRALVAKSFGAAAAEAVLARYPSRDYPSPRAAFLALLGDAVYICPTRHAMRALALWQPEMLWRAVFHQRFKGGPLRAFGAGHAFDLFFGFHHLDPAGYTAGAGEVALADAMVGYWSRFAKAGDPNGHGAVPWPTYRPGEDNYLLLAEDVAVGAGIRVSQCDFWNP
jgi:para-nitrobenzyl esterase